MHSVDENVDINLDDQNDAQTKKIKNSAMQMSLVINLVKFAKWLIAYFHIGWLSTIKFN